MMCVLARATEARESPAAKCCRAIQKESLNSLFDLSCPELFCRLAGSSLCVLHTQLSYFIEFKVRSRQGESQRCCPESIPELPLPLLPLQLQSFPSLVLSNSSARCFFTVSTVCFGLLMSRYPWKATVPSQRPIFVLNQ